MPRSVLARIAACALAVTVQAAQAEESCDFHAFSLLEDPNDAQVYAAPDMGAEVVGTLPIYMIGEDTFNGAEYRVTEIRDGWAHIAEVLGVARDRKDGPEGWIKASLVEVWVLSRVSFEAPDETSAVVAPYHWPGQQQVLGCSGEWAKLSYTSPTFPKGGPGRATPIVGWMRGLCGIPELGTCDGVTSDKPPEAAATNP